MRLFRTFIPVTCALLLGACDSAQDPTDTSLQAALQANTGLQRDVVIVDLGTLGGDVSSADYGAINDRGQVVASSLTASGEWHAFLWDRGVMTDLGTLGDGSWAVGLNNRGQVIGYNSSPGNPWRAFLWDRGVMTDLGTLGNPSTMAVAINDAGQIIGYDWGRCFIWERGVMADLGSLGSECLPFAINNAGQVVGYSGTATGENHAFLWQRGVMTDLGTLGGTYSYAGAINGRGQIVGSSGTDTGEMHAFLWERGVMTDLGTLYGNRSAARGINESGQVVGSSDGHAFLWDKGVMTDLGTGGEDDGAWAINNRGEVIGTFYTGEGADKAFYWADGVVTPLPALHGGWTWPTAINNAGQVLGTSDGHVVLWQLGPSMKPGR